MKDSKQSFKIGEVMATTILFSVVALLAILGSVFISKPSVLAQESPEVTRIAAIDESYFVNDRLAQGQGDLLEPRSDDVDSDEQESEEVEEEASNSGQCQNVYIEDHLRIDFDNDREEVLRLQSFLKTYENFDYVSLSGTFDAETLRAVKAFQTRYADDVLTPWGYQADEATGYVYITTKQKINEIYCDEQFLLTREQQVEIRAYREKLNNWRAQGASFETPQYLANYYGYGQASAQGAVVDKDSSYSRLEPRESNQGTADDGVIVTETPDDGMATTATSTDDGRGWFARLFGIGGDDDNEATTTATTSTTTQEDVDDEGDSTDDVATSATNTATTSGLDNVAAGVYNGINGIINFLLSPTFLLVVLVVLILLLVATLIEGDEDEEGVEDNESDDGEEDAVETETVEETADDVDTTDEAWEEYADTDSDEEDINL